MSLRACLSSKNVSELLAAQAKASAPDPPSRPLPEIVAGPVIDGVTLVDDTLSVLRGGAVAIAPLLIGANTDDANLFVAGVPAYANMSAAVYAAHIYASLHMGGRTPAPGRLQHVLSAFPPSTDPALNLRRFETFATDVGFVCAARETAAALRRGRPSPRGRTRPSAVYMYHYDHPYPNPRCADLYFEPARFGTTHTAEISYVFGQPTFVFGRPLHPERCAFDAAEAAFARQVGGLWASFARHGMPSAEWPRWEPPGSSAGGKDVDALVRLGKVATAVPRNGALLEIEHGWRAATCTEIMD